MICSAHQGRRRAGGTSSWSKTRQLATLTYKQKTIYARNTRVYFTVANYWLIEDVTTMTRAAGTALFKIHTILVHLYLVARAQNKHKI